MQEEQHMTIINSAELNTANRLTDEIKNDLKSAQQSLIQACIKLSEVRAKKLYKAIGCRNFEEYCEQEIEIKRKQGFKYATIGDFISQQKCVVDYTFSEFEYFQQLGVEKLYLIARTEEPIREEIAKAVDLNNTTVKELKARITELERQNRQLSEKIDDRFDRLEKKIQADREKTPPELAAIPDERPAHPLKPSFILFCDYIHDIAKLSIEERGELLTAIMYYTNNLPVPETSRNVNLVFGIIKRQIDRDYEKWLKTKEERTAAGKNGGLKTQENNRKNQAIAKANAKAVNVNVSDSVNASVPASDSVISSVADSIKNKREHYLELKSRKIDGYDIEDVAEAYNEICKSFPKFSLYTVRTAGNVFDRLAVYGFERIKNAFQLAEQSDFLKGENNINWKASFEWFFSDEQNIAKVLNGYYDRKITDSKNTGNPYDDDFDVEKYKFVINNI